MKRNNKAQKSPYSQPNLLELRAFVEQKRIYKKSMELLCGSKGGI